MDFPPEQIVLGYKISIRKFKKIEIIQSMICPGKPGHNRMKLEINSRKKRNIQKHVEIKQYILE